jgi:hypothetical protein
MEGRWWPKEWERCDPACEGYVASHVDREPGIEIEGCGDCGRFLRDGAIDDDAACVQFVLDLERGSTWALAQMNDILAGPTWQEITERCERAEAVAMSSGRPEPTVEEPSIEDLYEWGLDNGCEATDGCWVEPDGVCEHGHPSWMLKLGYI